MTRARLVPGMILAIAGAAAGAAAQTIQWASPVNGGWNASGNWNPMNVPDSPAESAVLGLSGAYTVTLDLSPTIANLQITNPDTVLRIDAGRVLTLGGTTLTNRGLILINPQNSGADALLVISSAISLGGDGEIWLQTNHENSQVAGAGTLTNGASHTIRGIGYVTAGLANHGLVSADKAVGLGGDQLFVFGAAKSNDGTMAAEAASAMEITSTTVTQSGGGELHAMTGGGQIRIGDAATIIGGELNSDGDGSVQTIGSPTLQDVVSNAALSLNAGNTLTITGSGLTNNGVIQINPQNSGADAHFSFPTSATLGGSGEVWLRTNTENSQINSGAGQVVTQAATHTIRGIGQIPAGLLNHGLVVADASVGLGGNQLYIFGEPKANDAVMMAAAGSLLDITGTTIDQTGGGTLHADATGQVRAGAAALIRGGVIDGDGLFSTIGDCTLESVTLDAAGSFNAGTTVSVTGSGLVNNNIIEVNPQNSGADAHVLFAEDGVLGGTGELRLRTGAENSQLNTAAGVTIVQAPTHTIRGAGQVFGSLVNNGRVIADVSVSLFTNTLTLFSQDKHNAAFMGAAAGSVLEVKGITLTQTGAAELRAADGNGQVHLGDGATIIGGELNSDGDGSVQTIGSPTLQDVVSNAALSLNAGCTLTITGSGLTNNGVIQINPQNSGADAHFSFPASATLGGSGEVWLEPTPRTPRSTPAQARWSPRPRHTIRGIGQIPAGLLNHGLVVADASVGLGGNQLYIFGEPKANDAVMMAAAGSLLDITGTTIDQTGGGTLHADATGQVRAGGAALIRGGVIDGDGLFSTIGDCTLESVTLDAAGSFNAGTTVAVTGSGLVNNNIIEVNPQNSGADAHVLFPASTTISGSGRLDLFTVDENAALGSGGRRRDAGVRAHNLRRGSGQRGPAEQRQP
ncbi:MAG: hypothetical protein IPJ41_00335 [Phycisphaerales bacterium]|nr:hypothetical protein [Phycisphaerales bacterium]